jgi:acetyl/propionyl-CoA carboxylase alpha subunit
MKYFITIGDRTLEVDLSGATPAIDGAPVRAEMVPVPGTPLRHLLVDGESTLLVAQGDDRRGRWHLSLLGERITADAVDERTRAIREMTGGAEEEAEKVVVAPMPGLVVKVEVEPGQPVKAGQGLVIVEAMKMENELKAPADGTVARIEVTAGQTVEKGAVLLVLE